jgi:hypothetical protein
LTTEEPHVKKADMEKVKGKAVGGSGPGTPDRYGRGSGEVFDKREQRRRDQEAGLVPFAVKLHGDLVKEIQALAKTRGTGLNEVADEVIRKGLKAK